MSERSSRVRHDASDRKNLIVDVSRNAEDEAKGVLSPKGRRFETFEERAGLACILFVFSIFSLHIIALQNKDSEINTGDSVRSRLGRQCSIYMAPSSVKGHSGFGIYTTRDIPEDTNLLNGPDGPSIPVVDYSEGFEFLNRKKRLFLNKFLNLFGDYWWGRGVPDHVTYESDRIFDYQITFGSLPNHHCILDTIDIRWPDPPYNDELLNRFTDPGAGAVSYSMGREFFAQRDVKANEELFLNYGHCERDEESTDWTSKIPMPEDYKQAAKIISSFWRSYSNSNSAQKFEIIIPKGTDERVVSLIPQSEDLLRRIMTSAKTEKDVRKNIAMHMATTPRSSEWIRSNGMCLESLLVGKSNIPQAGQGGFAQHLIPKGEIVVPAPTLHIMDRDVLMRFDSDGTELGPQLLLNYCLGHPESSFLLCPNTNAILVNHCSMRKKECGPKGPNAAFRWSTGWDPTSDVWRKMSLQDIAKEKARGLSMELYALRDIRPGDEVFVDYGIEWEKAWNDHVSGWKAPPKVKGWMTAKQANEDQELTSLMTGNISKQMDHPHLFAGCLYRPGAQDRDEVYRDRDVEWSELSYDQILNRYADDGSRYEGRNYKNHNDQSHWPCTVIRKDGESTFTVRIHQSDWDDPQQWDMTETPRLLKKYPRASIHFFVKPYESDQHLSTGFRHPIGIPSQIFPEQWKNKK